MKYYIKRINKSQSGTEVIYYKTRKCTEGWTYEEHKAHCWQFSKQGAEKIVERLRQQEEQRREKNRYWTNEYELEEAGQ